MENSFFKMNRSTMVRMLLIASSLIAIHTSEAQSLRGHGGGGHKRHGGGGGHKGHGGGRGGLIGACYGTIGANLPPASEVIALCKQHNIQRIRIYNPDPTILQALQGQPISVIVGVNNNDIPRIASSPSLASSWVQNSILNYPKVNFQYIAVGNEVDPTKDPTIAQFVPEAMQNIYDALSKTRFAGKLKVSTVLSMAVIGQSYPPSIGAFKEEYANAFINPIINFLVKTDGPFLIDVYPYFVYSGQPNDVRLDYALFTAPSTVVTDGQYQYQNLLAAMVDSVYVALDKAGGGKLKLVLTETGWPSAGGTGTTVENARIYNSNLLNFVRKGTPRRPGPIETYIFDLIDEDQKSPELEKHWGVFLANKQPKYPIAFY